MTESRNNTVAGNRREASCRSGRPRGGAASRFRTPRSARRRSAPSRGGFSLIEALVGTGVIGLGIVALLSATVAGTRTCDGSRKLTQAVFLSQEIREWTLGLPFSDPDPGHAANPPGPDGADPQVFVDDLDDLMNVTYSPPRNGQGSPLSDMVGWSETITLTWRDPNTLQSSIAAGGSDIIHVHLDLSFQGTEVHSVGWFVARSQ